MANITVSTDIDTLSYGVKITQQHVLLSEQMFAQMQTEHSVQVI